jgi:hypothetical protein
MSADMVEVTIDSIRVGLMSQQRVVILREVGAERYLAIWIDPYMAEQITFALQEVEVARPMSHDLIKNMLTSLDARIVRVEVVDLKGEIYFGNVVVEHNGYTLDIDSRPSDALALAVRANVPILVARAVMDEAGIVPEEDMGERAGEEAPGAPEAGGEEESDERLSVFEDFLDNLELGGKDQPDDEDDEDE